MERPFEAYQGDEPYVFICYSHDDHAVVYPEITWLHEQGIRVWYDEGISPGEEWTEELGRAIDGAERILYFLSPRSVSSRHCRNELNFAQNHNKSILSVYLEETALPSGVELVIGASQAIVKADFTEADFRARLLRSLDQSTEPPVVRPAEHRSRTGRRIPVARWVLTVLALLVVLVPAAFWFRQPEPEQLDQVPNLLDRSLAVLPLTVVGGDSGVADIAQALTEELRATIADYQELRTVAVLDEAESVEPTTSYVLRGNVQRFGENLRLRVSLIRGDDRQTVWAQTFGHPASSGTSATPELATMVGRILRKQIVVDQHCEPVRRSTRVREAADAYCAAVAEAHGGAVGGESDYNLALSQMLRAVELDPDIVDAHVFVGLFNVWLGEDDRMDWRRAVSEARQALDRSRALAPESSRTLGLKGRIEMLEMNYADAELSFRETISRDPLLPRVGPVHGRLALLAYALGDVDEALAHARRAMRIDDSNATAYGILGLFLRSSGHHREAIKAADAGLELVDTGPIRMLLFIHKISAHRALGEERQANEVMNRAIADAGSEWKFMLAGTLASLGRTEEAREIVTALERLEQPPTTIMAEAYAQLGDDRAFDWIRGGIDRHIGWVVWTLRSNPAYSTLHSDPRWAEVMSHLEAEEAKASAGKDHQSMQHEGRPKSAFRSSQSLSWLQLALEPRRDETSRLVRFFAQVGLPAHLGQLSVDTNDTAVMETLVEGTLDWPFTANMPFDVEASMLRRALRSGGFHTIMANGWVTDFSLRDRGLRQSDHPRRRPARSARSSNEPPRFRRSKWRSPVATSRPNV